jgi:AraC-like DNA-binding protein
VISRETFSTRDPEAAREFFADAYLYAEWRGAVDRETFALRSERLEAGAFQLDGMRMSSRIVSTFRPEDVYFITQLHSGSFQVTGRDLDERVGGGDLVLGGQAGVETTTDATDIRQEVVTVGVTAVNEAAGLGPGDGAVRFSSIRPVSAARARTWQATRSFLEGMLGSDGAADSPLLLGSAGRLLAGLLLETFPNSATGAPVAPEGDTRGSATLRRAISFIDSNAQRDIGAADIAAAARASLRTVEYAFRRHLDTTPTAYLRRVRLDHAHRELLAANPGDGVTVTEIAYRWGFASPSRLAEYYRAAYGVSPGDTLRS